MLMQVELDTPDTLFTAMPSIVREDVVPWAAHSHASKKLASGCRMSRSIVFLRSGVPQAENISRSLSSSRCRGGNTKAQTGTSL